MKAEYLNPFIEASQAVLKTILNTEIELGKIYLKSSPFSVSYVIIMIGVVGKIKGQVCLEMTTETSRKIASVMMGGMTVIEMDEISSSAISELGNMIMGNTCTIFSKNEVYVDITPPTILTGDKIRISNKIATISIPLMIQSYGNININVTVEEIHDV